MRHNVNWDLIISHLKGMTSDAEADRFLDWLHANPENQRKFDLVQKIWSTPEADLPKPDVDSALRSVMERAGIEPDLQASRSEKYFQREKPKRNAVFQGEWRLRILKIAALLIFMVSATFVLYKSFISSSMTELLVEIEQQETIMLSDGTRVTLDSGSLFKYPEIFDEGGREVFLNGEGYFDVTPDGEKPFIVHANNATIRVLGTEFNVRAWRENQKVVVVVADGRVSLNSGRAGDEKSEVIIGEGQVSVIEGNNLPSPPEDAVLSEHLGWIERKMAFKSTPLREVLDQLERWYGLEFTLSDRSYESHLITIFVDNRPIEDILEVIALMNDFQYMRDGDEVVFSPKMDA